MSGTLQRNTIPLLTRLKSYKPNHIFNIHTVYQLLVSWQALLVVFRHAKYFFEHIVVADTEQFTRLKYSVRRLNLPIYLCTPDLK